MRIFDRSLHRRERCLVKDDPYTFNCTANYLQVPDIALDEINGIPYVIQIVDHPRGEVVQDANCFTLPNQARDKMRPDETCTTCNKEHGLSFRIYTWKPSSRIGKSHPCQ